MKHKLIFIALLGLGCGCGSPEPPTATAAKSPEVQPKQEPAKEAQPEEGNAVEEMLAITKKRMMVDALELTAGNMAGGVYLTFKFTVKPNLTASLMVLSIKRSIWEAARMLGESDADFVEVRFIVSAPMTDRFGAESTDLVLKANYRAETCTRITEATPIENMIVLADEVVFIHAVLK